MSNQNDLLVIQNVLAGDTNAYAKIVDTYKDMAVTLAYNILLSRENAEEAAQDAFVKGYTALRSFKGNSKFSTWLYRIIINTALNKTKLRKPRSVELSEDVYEHAPVYDNSSTPMNGEIKKHIQLAMQYLNEKERICITLYYLQELSIEEINEATGFSTANIKILLYRGRKSLYKSLHPSI